MPDALGIVSNILTIFSFYSDLIPEAAPGDTGVGIGIGYATDPDTTQFQGPREIGARTAAIIGFDQQGDQSFSASTPELSAGQFVTTTGNANGLDSPYLEFDVGISGGAVCLAWLSVTYPSGAQYAFLAGDIFQYCNVGQNPVEWYYSAKDAGQLKDDSSTPYYPQCAWLDFERDQGHRYNGFGVNVPDFAGQNVGAGQALCRPPVLTLYTSDEQVGCPPNNPHCHDIITAKALAAQATATPSARQAKKRAIIDADRSLVLSDAWSHNATELCTSGTSRGPDFISYAEAMHCDMETRTLTPLCLDEGRDSQGCFRVDHQQKLGKREVGGKTLTKNYSRIMDWRR